MATNPTDMLETAAVTQSFADHSQQLLAQLQQRRAEQNAQEQAAQLAKQKADQAVIEAEKSQQEAITALQDTQHKFDTQKTQIHQLIVKRDQAQARLREAQEQRAANQPHHARQPVPNNQLPDRWTGNGITPKPHNSSNWDGEWDPTLPMIPSANIMGDPLVVINRLLGISQTSAQVTANMGQQFLQSVGLLKPGQKDSGITNGRIPRVYGLQASEYVIRRGLAQRGVPYSWGGGNAAGPSRGIGSGANTVGFDCSGLILYSFAGVGIKLPHYSGAQYKLGRQIPSALMRRGDVIFYGPGGSQHVTLYLGNGLMLEAPDVGQTVKVSPVRTRGMTPYVVRYIEY